MAKVSQSEIVFLMRFLRISDIDHIATAQFLTRKGLPDGKPFLIT